MGQQHLHTYLSGISTMTSSGSISPLACTPRTSGSYRRISSRGNLPPFSSSQRSNATTCVAAKEYASVRVCRYC